MSLPDTIAFKSSWRGRAVNVGVAGEGADGASGTRARALDGACTATAAAATAAAAAAVVAATDCEVTRAGATGWSGATGDMASGMSVNNARSRGCAMKLHGRKPNQESVREARDGVTKAQANHLAPYITVTHKHRDTRTHTHTHRHMHGWHTPTWAVDSHSWEKTAA